MGAQTCNGQSAEEPLIDGAPSYLIGVQSAAVNVICELARRNPKNYLSLAPLFFKLMTSSTNNWVLIKIIKLASGLTFLSLGCGKAVGCPGSSRCGDSGWAWPRWYGNTDTLSCPYCLWLTGLSFPSLVL